MWGEAWGVWGKVRGDVRGVKKCGKVSGEVWRVWGSVLDVGEVRRNLGKGIGGGGVGKGKGDVGSVQKCGGGVGERMG